MKRFNFLLVVLGLLLIFPTALADNEGVNHWYPLNTTPEDLGSAGDDLSAYFFDATRQWSSEYSNGSLKTDGSFDQNIITGFASGADISASAWIYNAVGITSNYITYMGTGSGADHFFIVRHETNGSISVGVNCVTQGVQSMYFTPADDTWNMYSVVFDNAGNNLMFYQNATNVGNRSCSSNVGAYDELVFGNSNGANVDNWMAQELVWNPTQIANLLDHGTLNTSASPPAPTVNFTIVGHHNITGAPLTNIFVDINGSLFNSSTGLVNTTFVTNQTGLYDIAVWSNDSAGFFARNYINYNLSSNPLNSSMSPFFYLYNITKTNFTIYSSTNFTRTLAYTANYHCLDNTTTTLDVYIGGSRAANSTLSCSNSTINSLSSTYQHSSEGAINIAWFLNNTYNSLGNQFAGNDTFTYDLNSPNVTNVSFDFRRGFVDQLLTNVTMNCTDSISPILIYNLSFNGDMLFYENKTSNVSQTNQTNISFGSNTATAFCADFFSNVTDTFTDTIYGLNLILVDEETGNPFDISNVTSGIVYFDDNSTNYNLKTNNANNVSFMTNNSEALRVELEYPSTDIITRFVDVSLATESPLRVCANEDDVTHYEQLIISSSEKPVDIRNIFADCTIGNDYTRFAYQDALILKAFTRTGLYGLFTYDNGQRVILASMDGSISTFYNLDVLEFKGQSFNFNIGVDALSFDKFANETLEIFYQNLANDSIETTVTITRLNTSTTVFSITDTTTPNQFYMYFDYSTLGVNENELFKIEVTTTTADGVVETLSRYFNTQGSVGLISSGLAFTISLLTTIFGLTIAAAFITIGWFGIVVMVASIAFLSLGLQTWYTLLLMAMQIIILVYLAIISIAGGGGRSGLV